MRHRRKGRRIYTYRVKNRRVFSPYHPMRSAIGTVVTLVLVAFLGIVGYNIVGPIVTRLQAEAESPTTTPNPYFSDTADTADAATAASVTQTTALSTETTASETTTVTEPAQRYAATVAYFAAPESLTDLNVIGAAAATLAQQGYTAVVLPVKAEGGMLQYASEVEAASVSGAVPEDVLRLRMLKNAVTAQGLECYVSIDTLGDQMYPAAYNEGAYTLADTGQLWMDAPEEEGGKPWISPFSPDARDYLSAIAAELSAAGFRHILCTGTAYPQFRESDLTAIGAQVSIPALRQQGLAAVLESISAAAPQACYVFDLDALLEGTAEAFIPETLMNRNVCVRIDFQTVSELFYFNDQRYDLSHLSYADQTKILLQIADELTEGMQLYPCIVKNGLSDEQLEAILDVVCDTGFDTVFVSET